MKYQTLAWLHMSMDVLHICAIPAIAALCCGRFGETSTGAPRAGTPARDRRSSITFVEEHSQLGSDLFGGGSQRFGGTCLPILGGDVREPFTCFQN